MPVNQISFKSYKFSLNNFKKNYFPYHTKSYDNDTFVKTNNATKDDCVIEKFKKIYPTEKTAFTFTDNTKTSFSILKGSKMGTNEGYYSINNNTGELYYTKIGGEQSKAEVLSSKLYNLAGIKTPEMQLIKTKSGKTGLISKYIPNAYPIREPNEELYKGFGMDCFLANWDAVISDNTITDEEEVYRIDLGGTLDFRAMNISGKKQFPPEVNELSTMLNPSINYGAGLFNKMSREDLISSVQRVVDIKNDDIIKVLEQQNMIQYKDVLLKRKNFMKSYLQLAQETPFNHYNLLDYSNSILAKIEENTKKEFSYDNFKELLSQNGINKTKKGNYEINIPSNKKSDLIFTYGVTYGKKFISQLIRTLSEDDIQTMYKFMNLNNGKYADFWKQDILDLVIFYNLLTQEKIETVEKKIKNEVENLPIGLVESIMDIAKDTPNTKFYEAFDYYKHSGYKNVNKYLLGGKKREEVIDKKKAEKIADTIREYIDTKEIKSPFTLYRGENYDFLKTITMDNGNSLGKTLEELSLNPDEKSIKELNENIKRNKYTSPYNSFISTAIFPNGYSEISNISYIFEIQPKCKGIYAEAVNLENYMSHEHEFLIKDGSKIQIENVELAPCKYLETKNHWVVRAKILPDG